MKTNGTEGPNCKSNLSKHLPSSVKQSMRKYMESCKIKYKKSNGLLTSKWTKQKSFLIRCLPWNNELVYLSYNKSDVSCNPPPQQFSFKLEAQMIFFFCLSLHTSNMAEKHKVISYQLVQEFTTSRFSNPLVF